MHIFVAFSFAKLAGFSSNSCLLEFYNISCRNAGFVDQRVHYLSVRSSESTVHSDDCMIDSALDYSLILHTIAGINKETVIIRL